MIFLCTVVVLLPTHISHIKRLVAHGLYAHPVARRIFSEVAVYAHGEPNKLLPTQIRIAAGFHFFFAFHTQQLRNQQNLPLDKLETVYDKFASTTGSRPGGSVGTFKALLRAHIGK